MSLEPIKPKIRKLFDEKLKAYYFNKHGSVDLELVIDTMGINERDFEILYTTPNAYEDFSSLVKGSAVNPWNVRYIFLWLLERYIHHGEAVLNSKFSPFFLKESVVRNGYYKNISSIDMLILEKEKHARALGASICDIDKCKALISDKEVSIRKIAFTRLGPVNYLDEMLKDRHATIRTMGVRFAPYAYPLLSGLIEDNSQMVLELLVDKIQYDKVPFLLANRAVLKRSNHVKNYFKSKIEKRLQRGA